MLNPRSTHVSYITGYRLASNFVCCPFTRAMGVARLDVPVHPKTIVVTPSDIGAKMSKAFALRQRTASSFAVRVGHEIVRAMCKGHVVSLGGLKMRMCVTVGKLPATMRVNHAGQVVLPRHFSMKSNVYVRACVQPFARAEARLVRTLSRARSSIFSRPR